MVLTPMEQTMNIRAQINNNQFAPLARRDALVVKKIDNETLVYDTEAHAVHCLNENAALIWEHCDGKRSVDELSCLFDGSADLSRSQKQQIIWIALNELSKSHLLAAPIQESSTMKGLSRRQMIKVAGIAAFAAIPIVSRMVAPTAAQASTCQASGQLCTISAECCSGLCSVGVCA
jgi:hypothetical protein